MIRIGKERDFDWDGLKTKQNNMRQVHDKQ